MHKKWSEFPRAAQLMQLQLSTGQRPRGINFVLHPTNTCPLAARGHQEWLALKLQQDTAVTPRNTLPAFQAACGGGHGRPEMFHPREVPRTVPPGLQRKSSESDLQKGPLNHSVSQIVHFEIV